MKIFLQNRDSLEYEVVEFNDSAVIGFDLLKKMDKGISNTALVMEVNESLCDLSDTIPDGAKIRVITSESAEGLSITRHSCAHLMAYAVKNLFKGSKVAIGPVVENGFYYDFDLDVNISELDFPKIEEEMRRLIKKNEKFEKSVWSKTETVDFFTKQGEIYKVDIVNSIKETSNITIYKSGDFIDLCKGPHVPSNGKISTHFKLMKVAGAYWRGDSNNKMLQRIYVVCFNSKNELENYIHMMEEAEKRDHRKLAKQMNLLHMQEDAVGSVFWHPRGFAIYKLLENFVRDKILHNGYQEIRTPQLMDKSIWETSGHWEKFRENMFVVNDQDNQMCIKPMNCPAHIAVYKTDLISYKKLPIRYAEFGVCHRNESSGSMFGIMRLRAFVQDDGHIFCAPEQINSETVLFCQLLKEIYAELGFVKVKIKYSDRPAVRAGSDEIWDIAEKALLSAAENAGLELIHNKGEGAFYGPKLEFVLQDAIGRDWQCGTFQVDFILPQRFNVEYVGEDGKKHPTVLLHRAVLGSLERFMGILLEHYAGNLPLWLAPEQVVLVTVTNGVDDYAQDLLRTFLNAGIRAELDMKSEKISYKIREHSLRKVPILCIIGEKEKLENVVTMRRLGCEGQQVLSVPEIIEFIKSESNTGNSLKGD